MKAVEHPHPRAVGSRGRDLGVLRRGRRRSSVLLCGASLAAVALFAAPFAAVAQNQTVYWDANSSSTGSGGTGSWNTTTALWSQSNSDVLGPYQAWANNAANPNNAVFGLTAAGTSTTVGTITLAEPIIAHNLTFQTVNGWILSSGTLTLAGTTPTINAAGTTTINSVIAGTAGFTKTGAGSLTLTGTNSFSGGITLNAGTLIASSDAALGATGAGNDITTAASTTVGFQLLSGTSARALTVGTGGTVNLVSGAAGSGSLRIQGDGKVDVGFGVAMSNDASSYTGTTTFHGCNGVCTSSFTSIADLGAASSLGAPTTVANGTITWQQTSQYSDNLIYLGDGDSSNRNWVFNVGTGGNLANQGTGALTLTGTMDVNGTIQFSAQNADIAATGLIRNGTGVGAVTLVGGAGSVSLGTANSYTGATNISGGAANLSVLANGGLVSSIGSGTLVNLLNNGVLNYTGSGGTSDRTFTVSSATGISNSGSGALTLTGPLSFVAGGPADTLTFGGSFAGTNIFSGVISGSGTVASGGSTTWQLSGANTFTGPILVSSGTLQAGSAGAFGTPTGVTVNGGTLDLNGFALTAPTLSGSGGQVALGSATLTVNGSTNGSYAGVISGTGGLTRNGTGTLTLTGTNTYSGPTTIGGGTLALTFPGAGSNIISSASSLNMAGGTVTITGASGQANSQTFNGLNVTAGNNKLSAVGTGGGTMVVNLGTISHSGGLMDFAMSGGGSITTSSADGALGWATINGSDYAQIAGGLITAFTSYVNKDDAGTWLSGDIVSDAGGAANTPYTGTVSGNVQLGGMKYTAAANSTVTIGAGATLGVDGTIIVSSSVGSAGQTLTGGSLTGTSGGGTLGIQQNGAGNFTVASTIIDNGGAVGFTKGGNGLVTLTNTNNSYTGATRVSGGVLSVAGIANGGISSGIGASSAASSNLILESGALQYTGATATTDRGFMLVNGGASRSIDVSNAGTNLTFTGLVTAADNASFLKSGPGTLTLANGGNDYTGATTVSGGILSVGTLSNGGTASGIGAASASASNLILQTTGTLQYTGGTTSIDRGFTLASGTGNVDVSQATTTLTVSGIVTGAGTLGKSGAGTLVLSGSNIFTGGVSVNAGTLRAGSTQAFGTGGAIIAGGATLDLNGFNTTLKGLGGAGTVSIGTATLTLNPNANPNFSGNITGTGGVIVSGGAQTFSGCNNTYSGPTSLQGSTALSVDCLANGGQASGIGASSNASTNLLFNNGALNYTGASVTIDRGFQLTASVGAIGVADPSAVLTMTGQAVGAGQLRKDGPGTLVLTGNNTYSGNTNITGGTLRAGSASAFGSGAIILQNNAGATLDLNGFNLTTLYVNGGGTTGGNISLSGGGTLTLTNPGGSTSFGGVITGNGNLTLNSALTETLTNCNSSYTGVTTINAGVIEAACLANGGSNSSIGAAGSAAGNLVLNGGTLRYIGSGGTTDRQFTLGSSTTSALDASGTGPIVFTNPGAISFSNANSSQTVTLTGTSTADNKLGAQIVDNGTGKTAFTKTGPGTWILTNAASSYTGVTTISGGVLGVNKLANGGSLSSIGASAGTAANLVIGSGGTLRYTGAGDTTDRQFSLGIGTTAIESSGTGAVVFSNTTAVSYNGTGARVVSLGGTNSGNNVMAATIGNQNGSNLTSLAKNGTGTWALTGTNSYTGVTNVNAGTLIVGNGGTSGSIASTLVNNFGTLGFNRSDTYSFGGVISQSGSVQQLGLGTTILTGTNTYTGGTTISAGTLQLGNGGTTGSIVGNVTDNGTLTFNRSDSVTFAGTISGSGAVQQTGTGTTTLTADNTYAGLTMISAGTLQLGNGGTTGSIVGNVIDNGTLSFNRSDSYTFAATISGNGAVKQIGTGTTILTADDTYAGLTTISAGTLQLGNGGTTGSIVGNVLDNSILTFNRAGSLTYGGAITGTGAITMQGGGTLTLTGVSNVSGAATVAGENLRLESGGKLTSGTLTSTGTQTITVTGAGSELDTSTGNMTFGSGASATNTTLLVENGGVVRSAGTFNASTGSFGPHVANVTVTGPGSLIQAASTFALGTNVAGSGSLTVSAGGHISSAAGTIGATFVAQATPPSVTITGAGSQWAVTGAMNQYSGSMSVLNGGAVTVGTTGLVGGGPTRVDLLVSGPGSSYAAAGNLTLGSSAAGGFATLADSGLLHVGGLLTVASGAGHTGVLNIGGAEGQAAVAAGVLDAPNLTFGGGAGRVNFNHTSTNYVFATAMSGAGTINQVAGITSLTGDSSAFTGTTNVSGGKLLVNGKLGGATALTAVASGATLGGNGQIGGDVTVASGGSLEPGSNGIGTLAISGNLSLGASSSLNFELGQANTVGGSLNDLVTVGGNLTLDGTLNVAISPGGTFGPGTYRLFNYGGTLTDNGLSLGLVPGSSTLTVQTSTAGQVNLLNSGGLTLNLWDGTGPKFNNAVNGGSGTWQNGTGNDNWTTPAGDVNAPYADGAFAIFSALPGTVTVDNSLGQVTASGMQFASSGYVVTGGSVALTGSNAIIRVGDGTAASASYTATINSVLSSTGALEKTDFGTLILGGANSYAGGTTLTGGTLQISSDTNLGGAGGLTFNGGTLHTTADIASARAISLIGVAPIQTDAGTTLSLGGVITGLGSLSKTGSGTLTLTAANSYSGGTTVSAGTLQVGAGGTSGSIAGDVTNSGALAFYRSDTLAYAGVISGSGTLTQMGSGMTVLTGDSIYSGITTISAGTLQLGSGGTTGSITSASVTNNGTLAIDRSDSFTYSGTITGTGGFNQIGSGTTILTGGNAYAGATNVNAGTLLINGDQSAAGGLTSVASGATVGGSGVIGGNLTVANGATLAPGSGSAGALTVNGNLNLGASSTLAYEFGQSNVVGGPLNDLTTVHGNLTLDGSINVTVTPGGSFQQGLYRIISYDGTLTDNGLSLGTLPGGTLATVQTSVAHQVNLLNATGTTLNIWDGAAGPANDGVINGGNGTWQNSAGNHNWTDGTGAINAGFTDGAFAIFTAAPGTVTIDNSLGAVSASGLQFAVDGYRLTGNPLTLAGAQALVRVGDGTAAGTGYTATIDAALTGSSQLAKSDLGTLVLTGANSYTGGTLIEAGTLRVGSDANLGDTAGGLAFDGGTLNTSATLTSARAVTLASGGTIQTDGGTTATFNGIVSGSGGLAKTDTGTLILTGANSYGGATQVSGGTLLVNGDQSAATGPTTVQSGATLGGTGRIGGNVSVLDGAALAPGGAAAGTLAINGNLNLGANATLNYRFGQAGTAGGALNDLVTVGGNLTLDGTINVTATPGGSFGPGIYRVFDYAGALTDNGLALGSVPGASDVTVQTSVTGQVNLVYASPPPPGGGATFSFWDGTAGPKADGVIQGGNGTWQLGGAANNWTETTGAANGAYSQGSFAIFAGTGGTVTIDNGNGGVQASGLQFAADGYRISGDTLTLTGANATIRVGDGSSAGAGYSATIDAPITGAAGITKTDAGTLILTGANDYAGATQVSGGTLIVNGNQSAAAGAVTVQSGATLRGTGTIGGDVSILDGATLAPGAASAGTLAINGNLALATNATLNYRFGQAGTVGGALNDLVTVGGNLTLDGTINVTATPSGSFGPGIYRVFTYAGALTDNGLALGSVPGASDVTVQTSVAGQVNLVYAPPTTPPGGGQTYSFWDGQAGPKADGVIQGGNGTWQLGGSANNWTDTAGATNGGYAQGTFAIFTGTGGNVVVDNGNGGVQASGMQFAADGYRIGGDALTFTGSSATIRVGDGSSAGAGFAATIAASIAGSAGLTKTDAGTLILTGANNYGGATLVSGGTLIVNGDQSAATGAVTVQSGATLGGTGKIGGGVSIADGATLSPGYGGAGTLTIGGDLSLGTGSTLKFELGKASTVGGSLNDLVEVGGNLTLGGTLQVSQSAGGSFDPGFYRLFDFGGALTDHGLTLGGLANDPNVLLDTSTAHQVNLINTGGLTLNYWDAAAAYNNAVNGGNGTWQAGADVRWTNASGQVNAPYSNAAFAVFEGTAGTVTIDNGRAPVRASGMQFGVDGYTITGGTLTLVGNQSTIRVGDGTSTGAAFTATISAPIAGDTQLVKADAGTLILSGTNAYTGGTMVKGGTLQVGSDPNLGAAGGNVSLNSSTLRTSADMTSARSLALDGDGTISVNDGTTLNWTGAVAGSGGLSKTGTGTLILTADNSAYAGATSLQAGTLRVDGILGGNVAIEDKATLQGNGRVGTVINKAGGVVAPGNSIGHLTVAGDYVGAGGSLEIEAQLGGDASPSDLLTVQGSTSGTTGVKVINRGGLGAQTVNGIKIIDVAGASNGIFALQGDYVFQGDQAVIAGAYGYRLYKGGIATPNDGDWYLRSALLDATSPPQTPDIPLYQPGVPIYEVYPSTLLLLNGIDTMQQRVGDRGYSTSEDGHLNGIWGRMQGQRFRPNAASSTSLADADYNSWSGEIGVDRVLLDAKGGTLTGGVSVRYGEAKAQVASLFGNGNISTHGLGSRATLTWQDKAGFYADAQAQFSWYDSDLTSATLGKLARGNGGTGQTYGLELGRKVALGGGIAITPQIQTVYSKVRFDRFTDPAGAEVSLGKADSLKTRWGVAIEHVNGASRLYAVGNLTYDWLGDTVTDVSGTPIARTDHRLWGELGLGGNVGVNERLTLYGEATANSAVKDFGKSYGIKGMVGVRMKF